MHQLHFSSHAPEQSPCRCRSLCSENIATHQRGRCVSRCVSFSLLTGGCIISLRALYKRWYGEEGGKRRRTAIVLRRDSGVRRRVLGTTEARQALCRASRSGAPIFPRLKIIYYYYRLYYAYIVYIPARRVKLNCSQNDPLLVLFCGLKNNVICTVRRYQFTGLFGHSQDLDFQA